MALRTVIRSHRFESELAEIEPKAELADEAVSGLEWVLARDPRFGVPIGVEPVWALPLFSLGPDLLVYYQFDDHTVTLLSVVETDL